MCVRASSSLSSPLHVARLHLGEGGGEVDTRVQAAWIILSLNSSPSVNFELGSITEKRLGCARAPILEILTSFDENKSVRKWSKIILEGDSAWPVQYDVAFISVRHGIFYNVSLLENATFFFSYISYIDVKSELFSRPTFARDGRKYLGTAN